MRKYITLNERAEVFLSNRLMYKQLEYFLNRSGIIETYCLTYRGQRHAFCMLRIMVRNWEL